MLVTARKFCFVHRTAAALLLFLLINISNKEEESKARARGAVRVPVPSGEVALVRGGKVSKGPQRPLAALAAPAQGVGSAKPDKRAGAAWGVLQAQRLDAGM